MAQKFGEITSAGELWKCVERNIPEAGFIRDLNNAGKHVQLEFNSSRKTNRNPSTGMHYAANTHISSTSFGQGAFGVNSYGGEARVRMDEGGREVSLEPIATEVYRFWKELIDEFYPAASL